MCLILMKFIKKCIGWFYNPFSHRICFSKSISLFHMLQWNAKYVLHKLTSLCCNFPWQLERIYKGDWTYENIFAWLMPWGHFRNSSFLVLLLWQKVFQCILNDREMNCDYYATNTLYPDVNTYAHVSNRSLGDWK